MVTYDFIWIDAICINQNDIGEVNDQVSRMGEIYLRAGRTVVWLPSNALQDPMFRFDLEFGVKSKAFEINNIGIALRETPENNFRPESDFRKVLEIIDTRSEFQEKGTVDLLEAFRLAHYYDSSNGQDKICGLLGICSQLREHVIIDYAKSPATVWTEAGTVLLSLYGLTGLAQVTLGSGLAAFLIFKNYLRNFGRERKSRNLKVFAGGSSSLDTYQSDEGHRWMLYEDTSEPMQLVFWSTLRQDSEQSIRQCDDLTKWHESFCREAGTNIFSFDSLLLSSRDADTHVISQTQSGTDVAVSLTKPRALTANKRLCWTELSRLGLLPREAEEGDLVAIFAGCATPSVVKRQNDEKLAYSMFSPAYIHGVIDEEAHPIS
ncbi:hypothetical protein B0T26DRAFT_673253 [Lasiosphaeria miniovina]|uniref:Heterokaryon incompatibility domain-containing protein n=1 Tax=Lasiosphaeria miniovina TaxID=1954250 RepID=A0AA40E5C3_9PEZI|nr:uncharacterized protein B0T26DRAFT_673253 [Lasiosphaeria miniovina]KAK0728779.1 hypothetical protein B0T26DRAFT_673253 [Lasiosphaeria miniovina]